jgi:hypothetical protein
MVTLSERLAKHSRQEGDCLVWTGSRDEFGYGEFRAYGTLVRVHRAVWIERHGPIPDETPFVLHRCDNPPCFRDEHLYLGTHADNSIDKTSKGRHARRNAPPPGTGVAVVTADYQAVLPQDLMDMYRSQVGRYCLVHRGGAVSLADDGGIIWTPDPTAEARPLPDEWFLRDLPRIDLADDEALVALMNAYGLPWGKLDELRSETLNPVPIPEPMSMHPRAVTHVTTVRTYLTALIQATDYWIAPTGDPADVEQFRSIMARGLRPFVPKLLTRGQSLAYEVDLFEAACMQLTVAMSMSAPVRICQNETCKRQFVTQLGGGHYYIRSAVKYCSPGCRNAQNQRIHRRRRGVSIT